MEHVAQAPEWAAALEASRVGLVMRQASWAYPAANLLHLLGLVLLVGPIMLLDLRVVGFGRGRITISEASRLLTPFAVVGVVALLVSGPLLFVADARALSISTLFLTKLALIVVALLNAFLFRAVRRGDPFDEDAVASSGAKVQALVSLTLWFTIAGLGRMIAYV